MKSQNQKQFKTLLIGGNPENVKTLIDFLKKENYKILIATNDEHILFLIDHKKPDLILLDTLTPNMDGFKTSRLIKNKPNFAAIPILFITALSDTDSKIRAFSAGAVDCIYKPFLEEEILARIETHLALYTQKKELYKKNKQLIESQGNLTTLLENTKDMIWSIDANYRLIVANSVFIESIKPLYKGEVGTGMLLVDEEILSEELCQQWKIIYDRVLGGEQFSMEIPSIISENKTCILVSYNPIYEGKQIIGANAFGRNITQRKVAEKNLNSAKEKAEKNSDLVKGQAKLLDIIFSHSLDNIVILDKDYNFIKVSDTYAKATQKDISDLIGKNHFDLYPSDFKDEADKAKKNKTIYSKQARPFVYQDHPEWGTTYWDLGFVPILDERNEVELFLLTLKDVTSEIISKQEAKESEERFRAITEQATEGITVATMEGDYVFVNPAFCKMSGYSKEELLKLTAFDMKAQNQPPGSFFDSKEKMEGIPIRVNLQRKDGAEYLTEIIGTVISLNNKQLVLGTIRDITERVKAENDLIKAKEKAQESDRLKSAFLTNMSHEIRTPMNGILGFSNLLKGSNLSGDKQTAYLEIIEKSGLRMLNTINDIIDISRIEAREIDMFISNVDINEQIEYHYKFFKPEAEKKEIQLSFKNSLPTQKAIIKSDKEKIDSILTNLIKNALKYSHKGHIEFGYNLKNDKSIVVLEFYVKDTGIGIPKNRQEVIFDRFIQVEAGNTRVYEGSGLGLSISKAYVEMLGGKIRVESEEGIGSKFYFTIPYTAIKKESENVAELPTEKPEPQIKKLKILIVDDDETARLYLSLILKKFKGEILLANTGDEAFKICRENPKLDLILMDVRMPEMDGYEATQKIRKFNKEVIIIAQTAFVQIGEHEKALAFGCTDYIAKPIIKETLYEMIYNLFAE